MTEGWTVGRCEGKGETYEKFLFVMDVAELFEGIVQTSSVRRVRDGVGVQPVVFREDGPCYEHARRRVDERSALYTEKGGSVAVIM